ncbi:MAG TPA: SPOR domain-containing protein [Candidatus Acidoferrales bacterium]|nr:SPOR domain-containing protein [Candidatus Acidoferrales bacterium]
MAENRKERGPVRYYFTRGQLVLLAAGFTLTSAIVFVLGIVIGQQIEENKLVKKNEPPLARIPANPLPPSAEGASGKNEMTFYDTLAKSGTKTKPAGRNDAEAQSGAPSTRTEEKPGAKKTSPKPEPQAQPEQAQAKKELAGNWTVQVNAFPHERDANELAKRLSAKGYDAYVVPVEVKGRTWYRVRVGRFANREQAKELQETMKTKEKLTNAITVSR